MEFQGPICFFLFLTFLTSSQAYKFNVGGSQGWVPNPSVSYNTWAGKNRFQINDTIVFKYKKGSDSVLEVKKEDYEKCNKTNPIKKFENGDTEFKFDRSGPFYFISGKDGNCEKGQKLIVVVLAPRTPPSPTTPSPPKSSPSPSPKPNPPTLSPPSSPPSPVAQPPSPTPSPASSPVPSTGPSAATPAPATLTPATSPSPTIGPPTTSPSPATGPSANSPATSPPAPTPETPGPIPSPSSGPTSSPPSPPSPGPNSSPAPSSNVTGSPKNSGTSAAAPSIVLVYFVTLVGGAVLLRY